MKTGSQLYHCIRTHYRGREVEALLFLWSLVDICDRPVEAVKCLKAIEANLEFDRIIESKKVP